MWGEPKWKTSLEFRNTSIAGQQRIWNSAVRHCGTFQRSFGYGIHWNPVLLFLLSPLWDTLGPLRRSAPGARCLGSKEPGPVCSKRGHGAAFLTPRKKLVDAADPVSSWNELPAPIEFAQKETRLQDWVSIHLNLITKHGCVCNLITDRQER